MFTNKKQNNEERSVYSRPTPIGVASWSVSGTDLTLTFNQPIILKGVSACTTDIAGALPVSATATGPLTVVVTFDADISLATRVNIPFEDPSVRNSRGGFISENRLAA
ncbi:MAG: hypothetical protein ACR2GY_08060 [Phycisphaerales bacterium]